MVEKEKRIIEGYTEFATLRIGGGEIILAENMDAESPYLVCDCSRNNPLGVEEYKNGAVSGDYLEAYQEFLDRANGRVKSLLAERKERGVPLDMFTEADCIKNSMMEDLEGMVLVIKPGGLHRNTGWAVTSSFSVLAATVADQMPEAGRYSPRTCIQGSIAGGIGMISPGYWPRPKCLSG